VGPGTVKGWHLGKETMGFLQGGDTLTSREGFTLKQGDGDGRAILTDEWGVQYVVDEQNQLEYVGTNAITAEVTFLMPQFDLMDERSGYGE
jgi:hypothetical protein